MKSKFRFFSAYLINIGYAAILSSVITFMAQTLGKAAFGNIFHGFVGKTILVDVIFSVALAYRFLMTGFRDREAGKASVAQFLVGSLAWLILLGYEAFDAFFHRFLMPATGIAPLALVFGHVTEVGSDNITEVLQAPFLENFLLSALAHIFVFTLFSYLLYILGIRFRERESKKIQAGEEVFIPTRAHFYFVAMFIPILNYVTFFPWLLHYCLYSERKLRRCELKVLLFSLVYLAFHWIRVGIYKVYQGKVFHIILYIVFAYLFGLIMSYIIYRDEKHFSKISERE